MGPTDRVPRLVGATALLAGLVACLVVAVDGAGRPGGGFTASPLTIHGPGQAALAVGLAGTGLVLAVARPPAAGGGLLAIAALLAAQLAGLGLVGFRRWPLYWGCCAPADISEQGLVRALSLLMAGTCAAAAATCVVALVVTRRQWQVPNGPTGVLALTVGVVVALAGPPLVVRGHYNDDLPDLAAWALMYALPLGSALALTGRMRRAPALAVVAAAALSIVAAVAGESYLELRQPWGPALVLAVVGTVAVAASRLRTTSPRTPAA